MGKKSANQTAIHVPTEARRELVKMIEANTGAYTTYDVFRDFLEMSAIAISNSVDHQQFSRPCECGRKRA